MIDLIPFQKQNCIPSVESPKRKIHHVSHYSSKKKNKTKHRIVAKLGANYI